MTYSQLKAFHALALEKHFHRAAEKLHLTQPAVSIQIRNLEQDSGRSLFRRMGHKVELTQDGLALFEQTRLMFEAEDKAAKLFSGSQNSVTQTIHLGADGPHVALDLILAVKARYPDIHFRVSLANADTTKESLLSLKIDAAVMANVKADSRIISQIISQQNLMALIPSAHPLSKSKSLSLETLASHNLVFREQGSNTQRIVDRAFAQAHLPIQPSLVMGSREGVREAVARGLGIGFVFDREVAEDPRYKGVQVTGFEASNADMLLCLKDQQQNPLVRALFKCADGL